MFEDPAFFILSSMFCYFTGIKGTGMSHLACLLAQCGNRVEGEDVSEDFFTSALLDGIRINPLSTGCPDDADVLIYSSSHERLSTVENARKKGIRTLSYPEAIAELSKKRICAGISGTHGKTTTCAAADWILRKAGSPCSAVYGSFLQSDTSLWHGGDEGLLVEACEYRDHFLLYSLDVLVVTSIAFDHPDWFEDLGAVRKSFSERVRRLERNATVIYSSRLERQARDWKSERPDVTFISCGPAGDFRLEERADSSRSLSGLASSFTSDEKNLQILYDYAYALLASSALMLKIEGQEVTESTIRLKADGLIGFLSSFPGVTARQEKLLEKDGVIFIDDYAHHPDEIRVCLDSLRRKYPSHRIVALFMPHTASRTESLMKDFVNVLSGFDAVFIQPVYASARADGGNADSSAKLYENLTRRVFRTFYGRLAVVSYVKSDQEAVSSLSSFLKSGDVLVTLGAGDNRKLIGRIAQAL